ncbi:antibiotic biosynthesis monooxygenase [Chryseobacterium chendengshani]|uniref:putative quinol monooxygenase n=1 Tax=Chryseobacterium sp. LJ668 TaxID=2864040 RepID=UPI001C692939|nr:antibiotic biosynthesis monooxygenase family protein [Chryseobacterium sp. LJ668]MBW8523501.1 antibiotic biosynthesis monooxygenase [Chryseobacterium sp. LJ668]QYK15786.1 antibiotic biosynthesis monooxygenase [Chryseobacterium sp. LJ668]
MENNIKPGTSNSHNKTQTTGITVSAYYKVHSEDRQIFIDAVIPEMIAANKLEGCIYYAFSQDLTDENTFHLLEGWADEAAYENHENSETFLTALSTVVKNLRILDREGVRYDISKMHIDDPRGKV